MPNLLSDGSYICSCAAERALPLRTAHGTPWDGEPFLVMPAPMDDPSFMPAGPHEHAMPPGDEGQFGRDISTEGYEPLLPPPSGTGR